MYWSNVVGLVRPTAWKSLTCRYLSSCSWSAFSWKVLQISANVRSPRAICARAVRRVVKRERPSMTTSRPAAVSATNSKKGKIILIYFPEATNGLAGFLNAADYSHWFKALTLISRQHRNAKFDRLDRTMRALLCENQRSSLGVKTQLAVVQALKKFLKIRKGF